jgi:hypothetical protein
MLTQLASDRNGKAIPQGTKEEVGKKGRSKRRRKRHDPGRVSTRKHSLYPTYYATLIPQTENKLSSLEKFHVSKTNRKNP